MKQNRYARQFKSIQEAQAFVDILHSDDRIAASFEVEDLFDGVYVRCTDDGHFVHREEYSDIYINMQPEAIYDIPEDMDPTPNNRNYDDLGRAL